MTFDPTELGWYSDTTATLGDRLTAAREAQSLSVAQLAARLGVRPKTLEGWENDRAEPRANRLQMLAGVLNVSLGWLLTGEGDGPSAPPATTPDLRALLAEVQSARTDLQALVSRLGKTEKKLRALLSEGTE
jgi:HTH-type transcriptional regulator, cell division transcriptional repressor